MLVQPLVIVGADVAAGKDSLDVAVEFGIDSHDIFEMPMLGAVLHHQDLAFALDDLRLDFAGTRVIEQVGKWSGTVQDLFADFRHAARAQGVGLARPAELRLGLLPGLQQGLLRPAGRERGILPDLVRLIEYRPHGAGHISESLLEVFNRLMHFANSYEIRTASARA